MRRAFTAIATIAILLVFTSSYNSYDVSVDINSFAPNFEISKLGNHFKLSETRGNYVIVNFWTSDDAEARIRNIHYDRFFKSIGKNLSFISVNFDDSDNMFKELVRTDGLSEVSQFYEKDGMESEVYKRYRLKSGMNSYLLDKDGKILAINPMQQQLTKYFCQ